MKLFYIFIFLLLMKSNVGISQNIDTLQYDFGNGTIHVARFNNFGVYNFTSNSDVDSTYFGQSFIRSFGPNCFIVNDFGNDTFGISSGNLESNFRLYKYLECDSISDTINCYIIGNLISGEYDKTKASDFFHYLSNNHVTQIDTFGSDYLFKLPINQDILNFSKLVLESGVALTCGPSIPVNFKLGSSEDPYYTNQYYLKSSDPQYFDINVEPAWGITKGSNSITIGIMDDGVSNQHPDISNNKLVFYHGSNQTCTFASWQYNNDTKPYWTYNTTLYPWDDPTKPIPNLYLRNAHGTAMAGIIGADHNSIGMKGIAPNCKIAPIKMAFNNMLNVTFAYDVIFGQGVDVAINNPIDVLNCSFYGTGSLYIGVGQNSKFNHNLQILTSAGRNGRGTTVVACTGNEHINKPNLNGIWEPADLKINGIIAVGACTKEGFRANYSNFGNRIDMVAIAPSNNNGFYLNGDIFSTDLPGIQGLNPTNITEKFTGYPQFKPWNGYSYPNNSFGSDYGDYLGFGSGTSVATAQVTGAVALLLSQNPCLKSTEVEVILKRNAKKVNANLYDYNCRSSEPGWNNELGYGLLDVFQSLIDPLWDQNVTYTSDFGLKGGTIYAGHYVTSATTYGDVNILGNGNVNYLAFHTIEIYEGFEVSNNGEFLAEIYELDFPNCNNWDKVSIPVLGETYTQQYLEKIREIDNHIPISNNLKYLASTLDLKNTINTENDIAELNTIDFLPYPNPNNSSSLNLKFSKPLNNYEIEVRNTMGSVIFQDTCNYETQQFVIATESLQPGIYFVFLKVDGRSKVKKIFIF